MCTGHRAFDQDTVAATREAILNQQPSPVRALRPQLPGRLEEIVQRAMERDRDRRYQTAAEIGTDLSSLKAELDSRVAIPPESSQPRQVKRKFEFRTAAIALAAVLVLISAVAWNMVGTSRSQPYHDFTVRQITNTGRAEQAAISPDGKYVLQVQDENGMKSLRLRNVASGSDTEILAPEGARFRSLAFSPDGDYVYFRKTVNSIGSEWDEFRMPVLGGKPLPVLRDIDSDITFSPDERRISYVRANDPDEGKYRIFTANLDGSNETVETVQNILGYGNDSYPPFDSWSPDGRHILYTFAKMADEPGVIRVLDLQNKHFDTLQHFPDLLTFDIHYLPGGKWILLANSTRAGESGSQIGLFSLKDGKLHPVTRDANSYSSISVSADGKVVAAVQTKSQPTIELLDVNAHGLTLRADAIASGFENVHSFDWQDDSHLIASDGTWLARVDIATGKSTELLSESKGSIVALAHCSTGAILINLDFQTGAVSSEIWKVNGDGSNPVRLSDGRYDMSPACSPDGKTAYYLDGTRQMKRVRLDGGKPEAVSVAIPNLERILGTFSFSPDGSRMAVLVDIVDRASNRAQARVAVFDLNSRFHTAPRLLTPAPGVNAGSLHSGGARFSADGNSILYVVRKNGVANLWTQPLDETPGHVITNYSSDTLSHFRLSPSGRTIAMRRVHTISDIVLLKDAANP
jgi:Tol biopolymer transport system component